MNVPSEPGGRQPADHIIGQKRKCTRPDHPESCSVYTNSGKHYTPKVGPDGSAAKRGRRPKAQTLFLAYLDEIGCGEADFMALTRECRRIGSMDNITDALMSYPSG